MRSKLVTPAELARRVGVSPAAVVVWADRNLFPVVRTESGRRLIVDGPALARFLMSRQVRSAAVRPGSIHAEPRHK